MICSRCRKRLKKAYRHRGLIYGPECIKKVGGEIIKSSLIRIKDAKEKDNQLDLF
jgi:predicted restriction endonuclease